MNIFNSIDCHTKSYQAFVTVLFKGAITLEKDHLLEMGTDSFFQSLDCLSCVYEIVLMFIKDNINDVFQFVTILNRHRWQCGLALVIMACNAPPNLPSTCISIV